MRLSTARGCQSSRLAAVLAVSFLNGMTPAWCDNAPPDCLIGFTALRTNLSGGRLANEATMRASVIQADGTHRREIAAELANGPNAWTQFAGWSPDGKMAIVLRCWEDPENARWEEEHKQFRHTTKGWLIDVFLVDIATGKTTNLTAIDRVSDYNTGLFFWPNDPNRLGFTALIGGQSRPFSMDKDGRNKRDLSNQNQAFTYGFSASPDGKRISYHKNYRIHLADADGGNLQQVETGHVFNFAPQWSPNGQWVLFVAGEHYNCHPFVVRSDGTGLRKLADRNGYKGVVEFLDVFDFHGGSSDIPVWSADGMSVFFTAKSGSNVEVFQIPLDGKAICLTTAPPGTIHYHPVPQRHGNWLLYGSKRSGIRDLYLMNLADKQELRLTHQKQGQGAMWAHWQPRPNAS